MVNHHHKLYPPWMYRSEDRFFGLLTPAERAKKEEEEVAALSQAIAELPQPSSSTTTPGPSETPGEQRLWHPVDSQIQMIEHQRRFLRTAEDLAIRALEREFGVRATRDVVVHLRQRDRNELDAILKSESHLVLAEVKTVPNPLAQWDSIEAAARKIVSFRHNLLDPSDPRDILALLALVFDRQSASHISAIRGRVREFERGLQCPIELRCFVYEDLLSQED
ncbi:MAG: hypothetical protein IT431_11880 [Phycisphaerales bacterium]|nr:hypothetical protein [Phycisphaerales bacterium]